MAKLPAKLRPMGPKSKTDPEVFIIESLRFEDEETRREGEIIERALRMAGKNPQYHYVRTREELEHFADVFEESDCRYLHISMHGAENGFELTLGSGISVEEFAEMFGPVLDGRRLFLSTCLSTTKDLARSIFKKGECRSVAGPVGRSISTIRLCSGPPFTT